jgi:AraC family transcriptional regulator
VDIIQNQLAATPQPYCDLWHEEGPTKLLSSSANRGWSRLSAEVWAHGKGLIPWRGTPTDIELCVGIRGGIGSVITRRAAGILDQVVARRNMVWLCPPGWEQGSVEFSDNLPEVMHIYLPAAQFASSNLDVGALRYETAFQDSLLGGMVRAVASELRFETSAGRLLVEALANSMAVRLVQKYIAPAAKSLPSLPKGGLDRRRLLRVLDYIEANLEGILTLDCMASIACLSRFHFARAFKQAVGESPYRYVSNKRLERAKFLLTEGNRSLVDVALTLSFSSQANFVRSFKQATGLAPGQYRRQFGLRHGIPSPAEIRHALTVAR